MISYFGYQLQIEKGKGVVRRSGKSKGRTTCRLIELGRDKALSYLKPLLRIVLCRSGMWRNITRGTPVLVISPRCLDRDLTLNKLFVEVF